VSNPEELARILIAEIDAAIKRGVLHYDKDNRPLRTVKEVLIALCRDKEITFQTPEQRAALN
jgi:hypothetical protein